jgi:hypothetical protein
MMLNAPRGVTSIAGANAYAAKLATSPRITARKKVQSDKYYLSLQLMIRKYYTFQIKLVVEVIHFF